MEQAKTITVRVFVRHSADCKFKKKGSDFRGCDCRKSLLIYEGDGSGKNKRESARTRSWEKAEERAQERRDDFDPAKQELKKLRDKKKNEQKPVAEAVALYIQDMAKRLGDNGTCAMARSLFGKVDPETYAVVKNGHLFNWLDRLSASERPAHIGDFSPALVTAWRATWDFRSDLTTANRWSMTKSFFNFCHAQSWIEQNPCTNLQRISVRKGNRTAIFSDQEYKNILGVIPKCVHENVPELTRGNWQRRLEIFVELLRWSGMAMVDGVLFRPDSVDADGVLRYRRQKTRELATVPLPNHVLRLLKDIPLERDSFSADQPFRTNVLLNSDTARWSRRIDELFELAGITEVHTGIGTIRRPHPHMLRDTFAVWHLRHGAHLHTVSKMLGHSKTATTEKAYLPWVKELEDAHIADARRALSKALKDPKLRHTSGNPTQR